MEFVRNVIGGDRMMYAMDYPWQFEAGEVGALDSMEIGEEALKAFFECNARRLFEIDA